MAYKNDADKKAAARRHYEENKEQYYARRTANRDKVRGLLREAKAQPCSDCGIQYPYYVMQFDHLPGFEKTVNPSQLPNHGSVKKFQEEIAKCEVVCANCHAERTHVRSLLV